MHETEIIPFSSLARAAAAQTLAGTSPVLGKGPRGGSGGRTEPWVPERQRPGTCSAPPHPGARKIPDS